MTTLKLQSLWAQILLTTVAVNSHHISVWLQLCAYSPYAASSCTQHTLGAFLANMVILGLAVPSILELSPLSFFS